MPLSETIYGLTALCIEELHDKGIAYFFRDHEPVGPHQCIDRSLLESAPLQPFQSAFEVDAYPTIYDKAACLFFSIAGGHIFTNGNKRTGVLALDCFLMANAIYLNIPNDPMVTLTRQTASHRTRNEDPADVKQSLSKRFSSMSLPFYMIRKHDPSLYRRWHRGKWNIRDYGWAVERSRLEAPVD